MEEFKAAGRAEQGKEQTRLVKQVAFSNEQESSESTTSAVVRESKEDSVRQNLSETMMRRTAGGVRAPTRVTKIRLENNRGKQLSPSHWD